MNSEKVKEIKKALETCMHTRVSSCRECPYNYTNTKTKHSECFRMAEHALTLINVLENENERLRLERDVLIGKKIVEKQKHDNAIIVKIDIQKQLKNRIAELEDKIENGTLVELPCKVGDTVYFIEYFCNANGCSNDKQTICCGCSEMLERERKNQTYVISEKKFRLKDLSKINKTLYITKAEAEVRLKELQEEQK